MEGVDPTRVVAIGAMQGADGALDGCLYLNQQVAGACRGALSLSPGSHLQMDYPEIVAVLLDLTPDAAIWCLGNSYEIAICEMAAEKGNEQIRSIEFPGINSGMMLLQPGLDPLPMQTIIDFLAEGSQ